MPVFVELSIDSIGNTLGVSPLDTIGVENLTTYEGLFVDDSSDDGLAVDTFNGLAINSTYAPDMPYDTYVFDGLDSYKIQYLNTLSGEYGLNTSGVNTGRLINLDTASYNVLGNSSYNTRYAIVNTGNYNSSLPPDLLTVNNVPDYLDVGGNFKLSTSDHLTYNITVDRHFTNLIGEIEISPEQIGLFYNQVAIISPIDYFISGFDVVYDKTNSLYAQVGNYDVIGNYIFTTIENKIIEGRYTYDSDNNYTLYVDKDTDYFMTMDTNKFGYSDMSSISMVGKFFKHPTDSVSYDLTLNLITPSLLKLSIPKELTTELYSKYFFEINITRVGLVARLVGGVIIINGTGLR